LSRDFPYFTTYAAELTPGGVRIRHHAIQVDGYRAAVSHGAFFHGKRSHDAHHKRGIIWNPHTECDHLHYTEKRHADMFPPDGISIWPDDVPIIEHDSIWNFYKYVGYNYKTRKWTGD
jgi:hypothetical protein